MLFVSCNKIDSVCALWYLNLAWLFVTVTFEWPSATTQACATGALARCIVSSMILSIRCNKVSEWQPKVLKLHSIISVRLAGSEAVFLCYTLAPEDTEKCVSLGYCQSSHNSIHCQAACEFKEGLNKWFLISLVGLCHYDLSLCHWHWHPWHTYHIEPNQDYLQEGPIQWADGLGALQAHCWQAWECSDSLKSVCKSSPCARKPMAISIM